MFARILYLLVVIVSGILGDNYDDKQLPIHAQFEREGKTILMIPIFHPSLARQMMYLSDELCQRGHKIVLVQNTALKHVAPKSLCKNRIKVIEYHMNEDMTDSIAKFYSGLIASIFATKDGQKNIYSTIQSFVEASKDVPAADCNNVLNNVAIMKEIAAAAPDFAIVDGVSPCKLTIPYHLSIPFATISGAQMPTNLGIPWLPSVTPNLVWHFSDDMSFFERLTNIWLEWRMVNDFLTPDVKDIFSIYAPGIESYRELFSHASLIIQARDHHLEYQVPSMPYTLFLPGLTATEASPVSAEIEAFIGNSKLAVVSFGSLANAFPLAAIEPFLTAFTHFPNVKFFWSLDTTKVEVSLPPNVKAYAWLPQVDLLGHPNAALFICHCGNSGQYEAAHQGVPMIGFPLFISEQDHNCRRAEDKGISRTLHVQNVTVEELVATMRFVFNDAEMNRKAKKLAAILKSYKPPIVRAADAIEHVVKFGGEHLNGTTRTMPLYKLYMLDIFAAVFLSFVLIWAITCFCCLKICRKLFCTDRHLKVE